MTKIAVAGAGAWGTALGHVYAQAGSDVLIWAREQEVVDSINTSHQNSLFLPGTALDEKVKATNTLTDLCDSDAILIVSPAQYVRSTVAALKDTLDTTRTPLVICAKGIEIATGRLLSDVVKEEIPEAKIAILTGPTFASEIAKGLPSAVTLSTNNKETGKALQLLLAARTLRPYLNDDIISTQIGGAVKNVIAIGCGMVVGKGLGDSARAALMTRGLAEMGRLAAAMGARKETLMGLCGIGDLMLTGSSMQSRNFSFGMRLGQGESMEDILGSRNSVTEGVHTAKALMTLSKNNAIDMPVSKAVHDCLVEGVAIEDVIDRLLDRSLKDEGV